MSEPPIYPATPVPPAAVPGPSDRPVGVAQAAADRWKLALAAILAGLVVLASIALVIAWRAGQRVVSVEQELVRRQQDSASQASEARLVAREAQDAVRDAAAKLALLEARVAEVSAQRSQLEDLVQSLSRSRDENLLGDIESAVRVASQQTLVTGSAEPLVAALKQSDERLARHSEPRLDGVRRAVTRDLDRIKAAAVSDIPSLGIKLDEAIRLVDDVPLLASADGRRREGAATRVAPSASPQPASAPSGGDVFAAWSGKANDWWELVGGRIGTELRSLVRVTRVDHPDAMLLAPEQGYLVRENLKLRLLNARLGLISRQFDNAQSDLGLALRAIERYFEPTSRRTAGLLDLLRGVSTQMRQLSVPRPDETLAALAAAAPMASR